jgi:hypothetical protein
MILVWALLACNLFLFQRSTCSVGAFSLGRVSQSPAASIINMNVVGFRRQIINPRLVSDQEENLILLRRSLANEKEEQATSLPSFRRRPRWKSLIAVALSSLVLILLPLQDLLLQYRQLLAVYPLRTKVATGAVLAVVGDALAQSRTVALQVQSYDSYRAASFAAFDSCYRVFQHIAFPLLVGQCRGHFLGRILKTIQGGADILINDTNLVHYLAATEQTMAYQLCVVPMLYYPVFFTFTGFMQGLTRQETLKRMKKDFIPCWKRNLLFWIPVQFYMFGFLDQKWQIPFSCIMGIVWSTILSTFAGRAGAVVTCVGDECDVE